MTDHAALRALCAAAPPGPWRFKPGNFDKGPKNQLVDGDGEVQIISGLFGASTVPQTFALCAAARTAIPELLDEIEALKGRILFLEAALKSVCSP